MIDLSQYSTEPPEDIDKEESEKRKLEDLEKISELQTRLFASKKKSLLVILQGVDASGKDGTVKKLFTALNPLGCTCKAWKVPTEEEFSYDFLWRIHKAVPAKGMIQVFNRSHYEDILVPLIRDSLPKERIRRRIEMVDAFETLLVEENDTKILKFFLHISKKEQKKRIDERLEDPKKLWKFDPSDLDSHKLFQEHRKAYEFVFENSKSPCNWEILPSDKKWYRDFLVAKHLRKALEEMDLQYPSKK